MAQFPTTIRVPHQTPMYTPGPGNRMILNRTWMIFFERLGTAPRQYYVEGTHAQRIDPDPDNPFKPNNWPPGALYYETDRTVTYQMRLIGPPDALEAVWLYHSGTMEDTLANRPTDLGTADAGFQFAAIDTGQSYVWDGTAWVDVTLYPSAMYGTHTERLAQPLDMMTDGALWVETDRGNAVYQLQAGLWWYLAGTMFGTLVPDQRPADLGVRDAGFDFRTSVPPARQFMWSQTEWVEVPAESNAFNLANASAPLTLTTAPQDIPGATLTIGKSGLYWLQGIFDFNLGGTADIGYVFTGILVINGVAATQGAVFVPHYVSGFGPGGNRATVAQQWSATLTTGAVVKLQASKTGGAGSSQTFAPNTTLGALWVSP